MFNFKTEKIDFAHKLDYASDPKDEYAKHMHTFVEILLFIKGDVTYTIESETHKLKKGDIVVVSSGKYHFAEVNHQLPYERYVLKINDEMIPEYLRNRLQTENPFYSNTKSLNFDFQTLDDYERVFTGEDLETLFYAQALEILVKLTNDATHIEVEQNEFVSRVITYIDDHIKEDISLESLAENFSFSKSHMSNEFKKYMKTPLMRYIKTKKVFAAHDLIKKGYSRIKASEELGFEDYSTFYRLYVKTMGVSPSGKEK